MRLVCRLRERNARPRTGWTPSTEKNGSSRCARHGLRFRSVATDVGVPGPVGRGAREEIGLLRPIGEVEIRDVAVCDTRRRIFAFEVDDAFRFGKGQTATKQNAINQAEDGGICSDAERDGR